MKKFVALLGALVLVTGLTVPSKASSDYSVSQKTLSAFNGSTTTLTAQQKAQVKAAVDANPSAEKFICTGIRYFDQPMSVNIMVRKRAKAACEYAKELNPALSTWFQNKPTQARSYAGKVLLTVKSPNIVSEGEQGASDPDLPSQESSRNPAFQDPWEGVEIYEDDFVPGAFAPGDALGYRVLYKQGITQNGSEFQPIWKSFSWYECPSALPTASSANNLEDCFKLNNSDSLSIEPKHLGKAFAFGVELEWVRQSNREIVARKFYASQRSPIVRDLPKIQVAIAPVLSGSWEAGSTAMVSTGAYSGGAGGEITVSVQTFQCVQKVPEFQIFQSPAYFDLEQFQCRLPSYSWSMSQGEIYSTNISDRQRPSADGFGFFTAVVFASDSRQTLTTVLQARERVWENPLKKAVGCEPQGWNGTGYTQLSGDSLVLTLAWKREGLFEPYQSQLLDCLQFNLEMPAGVRTSIDFTNALQGVKTASWDRIFASWAFSTDTGLVMRVEFSPPG